jgi:hypothetical protein
MNVDEFIKRSLSMAKAAGGGVAIYTNPPAGSFADNERMANEWLFYFESVGLWGLAATCRGILSGRGKAISVPCEKPELFDLTYVPPSVAPSWRGEQAGGRDASSVASRLGVSQSMVKAARAARRPEEPEAVNPVEAARAWLADPRNRSLEGVAFSPEMRRLAGLAADPPYAAMEDPPKFPDPIPVYDTTRSAAE